MIGSRVQVMRGSADKTTGGLTRDSLKKNKRGKVVYKSKSSPMKGKLKQDEFYCLSCRGRTKAQDPNKLKEVTIRIKKTKTNRSMVKAKCAKCESKVCKLVKQ